MAKTGQMIEELFISLGLDIAKLELDFDTAGKTVSNAIAKLNSSGNKIKLQMETDLAKLDGVGSELDKIRVKHEAINKQLDLQRQKESILAAVLKDAQKNLGSDSGATRKAEIDLLRQQKLIAQTEAEFRRLEQAKIAAQGTIQLNVDGEKVKTALNNIQDSIARTNAKIQNLRLKTDIDISGLRGVNAALEAEKITAQNLNRELDLQQQKLRQLQNAYNVNNKNYGGNNIVTLNAQSNVLRQIQEVEKLQAKIREIQNAKADIKVSTNTNQAESYLIQSANRMKAQVDAGVTKINSSLARIGTNAGSKLNTNILNTAAIQNLSSGIRRVNIELSAVGSYASSGFGKIMAGANAAKNAVAGLVGGVNQIQGALLAGAATTAGVAGIFKLSEGAVKAGHDSYLLASRLHTTTGEAGQLKRAFGMIDADASMMIPIFARLGKQLNNAGEEGNSLTTAMQDFDFTLTDASGRMLPYTQMLAELAKGYRNAQEAGETTDFVSNVLGARGANLEPLLANYEALVAASKDVKTTGLLDPQSAEIAYREMKKLEFETGQLKSALGASLLPITRELMPEVVSGFKTMVGFISENKDGLKSFGQIAGDVFGGVAKLVGELINGIGSLKNGIADLTGTKEAGNILKQNGFEVYLKTGANTGMILGGMIGGAYGGPTGAIGGAAIGNQLGEGIYSFVGKNYLRLTGEWDYYQQKAQLIEQEKKAQEDLKKIRAEMGGDWDESENITERRIKIAEVQKNLEKEMANATSQRLRDKLVDIEESTKKSIEAGQSEAKAWKKAEKEISKAIKETHEEAEKANEELKQSIYELTHNDLQNKFDKVDLKSEELLNRGADADLVNQNAALQRQKIQEEFDRDVLSKVNQSYQTDLQNRLGAIEQEKQAYIKKGLDEV